MSYTLDDLKKQEYAVLQKGERAVVRIDTLMLTDNNYRKGRKNARFGTIVTNGVNEGKHINFILNDGSYMYDTFRKLLNLRPTGEDDVSLVNLLNHNEGLSRCLGRTLQLTGDAPKADKNDPTIQYTNVDTVEVL